MDTFTIERIYSPEIEKHNILNAIADKRRTQKDVAMFYADCIVCHTVYKQTVDFATINAALLARWPKGLERVKKMAWKLAEAQP